MAAGHVIAIAYLALAAQGAVWAGYRAIAPAGRSWLWFAAAAGLAWTVVNTHALLRNKAWAERSSRAYWLLPFAFWCCIPIPIWAAWRLFRADR